MPTLREYYGFILRLAALSALLVSLVELGSSPPDLNGLLLLALIFPAAWLRINLEPAGYITLAPVVVFTGFLTAWPSVSLFAATLSPLVSAVAKPRNWGQALRESGEEAVAVAAAIAAAWRLAPQGQIMGSAAGLMAFALICATYITMRLFVMSLGATIFQGLSVYSFFSADSGPLVANSVFFALVSLAVNYLTRTYGNSGYFVLALATVALVETYHPYKLLSDQREALYASLAMIAQAIDLKDAYTGRHARDASKIAVRIARALGLREPEVRKVEFAAILHDIGKIGVSSKIIRKPAGLSPEEMTAMQQHPVIGSDIMRPVELLRDAAEIVRHHHEHFDGSGYPDGLRGEDIPRGSRIVLVADAFNAMTTDRPYRRALPRQEALRILDENSGTQFDLEVVQALKRVIDLV